MTPLKPFFDQFPDADQLLSFKPENVVPALLRLALARGVGTMFLPKTLTDVSSVDTSAGRDYPAHKREDVRRFLERAWRWAEGNKLVEPAPGPNGHHGWKYLTDDGTAVARDQSMTIHRAEKPAQEEWIKAADAIARFGRNYETGVRAICKHAHAGLVRARAKRFIRSGKAADDVEVPKEFWWAGGETALNQDWTTGSFDTWIDRQSTHLEAFGVTFWRADIDELIPEQTAQPASPNTPLKSAGGRPPIGFWDDLWIEIFRQIWVGELRPTMQRDITNAMSNWIAKEGRDAGDTAVKERARKFWAMYEKLDGN